jgi:hypothetical protein
LLSIKRFLVSLAAGIVTVVVLLLGILFAYKLFFPGSAKIAWLLAWPMYAIAWAFPSAKYSVLLIATIATALATYIAVATLFIYLASQMAASWRRKKSMITPPPKPPASYQT